mgnify:CR=1 FL=1
MATVAFVYSEMYWIDLGDRPQIAKANMDGSDDKSLVVNNIRRPNGLAIDYPDETLYWVDWTFQLIQSIRLKGLIRRVLTHLLSWTRFHGGRKRERRYVFAKENKRM